MDYETFGRLSIRSLINAISGYNKRQEMNSREAWETTRFAVFHLLNIQLDKKDKLRKYQDLVMFPWEPKPKIKPKQLTAEEFDKIIKGK